MSEYISRYTGEEIDNGIELAYSVENLNLGDIENKINNIQNIISTQNTEISNIKTNISTLTSTDTTIKNQIGNLTFKSMTQVDYNALTTKDSNTIYFIVG